MKWILVLIFITGTACAQSAAKGYTDGNDLREDCEAAITGQFGYGAGYCFGLIEGYLQATPAKALPTHCVPMGVTVEQLVKVIVKYLDQHPEKLHLTAFLLISQATHEAFPCSAKVK